MHFNKVLINQLCMSLINFKENLLRSIKAFVVLVHVFSSYFGDLTILGGKYFQDLYFCQAQVQVQVQIRFKLGPGSPISLNPEQKINKSQQITPTPSLIFIAKLNISTFAFICLFFVIFSLLFTPRFCLLQHQPAKTRTSPPIPTTGAP